MIVPLALFLIFLIRICTGACCWKCALWTTDMISSSILLGRRILLSVLKISCLTALHMLDLGAGARPVVLGGVIVVNVGVHFWFLGGTLTHCLFGVGLIVVVVII